MAMGRTVRIVLWVFAVWAAVALCRTCWLTLVEVPQACMQPSFLAGDRLLVDRWQCGFRVPFMDFHAYHRWGRRRPAKGDWVVFNMPVAGNRPDTSALCVGRVMGCPGDTVWMGAHGRACSHRSYAAGCIWPVAVPAARSYVQLCRWNAAIYHQTIRMHELDSVAHIQEDASPYFRFAHNYYWMESGSDTSYFDSRVFGFVPEECLVGTVACVAFSLNPDLPLHQAWRRGRFLASPYE